MLRFPITLTQPPLSVTGSGNIMRSNYVNSVKLLITKVLQALIFVL